MQLMIIKSSVYLCDLKDKNVSAQSSWLENSAYKFKFISYYNSVSFRKDSGAVFLRYNGQDVINLSAADKEVLVQGERFRYFGNFIIVRRVNNAFKRIINQLNSLGLSFDGTTVQIVTRTQPDIFGPGVLYIHQSAGVTFYTNNSNLIQRISDALNNPGGLPTPPPEEGKSYYTYILCMHVYLNSEQAYACPLCRDWMHDSNNTNNLLI